MDRKEINFEEEFPSLRMESVGCSDIRSIESKQNYFELWVNQDKIMKYCLDKQRVKDAIDKRIFTFPKNKETEEWNQMLGELKKELGLK